MATKRHKVFISFHHGDEQYKNFLIEQKIVNLDNNTPESIFDNYSVGDGDIDDSKMEPEQIRKKIRKEYIQKATVMVLLCGKETRKRKHIDWEIQAAMYSDEKDSQLGIIVISLPTIKQCVRHSDHREKKILGNESLTTCFFSLNRNDHEKNFPYMPSRIIDNLMKQVPITVVSWKTIQNKPKILMQLIDNAFIRKDSIVYDHSTPLRRNNT